MRWADDYISAPHAELGRKGPICPFVHKTVVLDRLFVSFHDEIDGSDIHLLQDVLIAHSERLKSRFPEAEPDGTFTSVLVVLPSIPDAKTGVLDDALQKLKSHLMAVDVMTAAFHARSTKPATYNPDFRVYRAPLPCVVLRHMDVRDIVFLGHNRLAFTRYRTRFEDRFARGLVSNDFGYVDRYNEATERFPRK
jgi:heptaprenyl diphosphate synthase